ncbi:uncharacterized protein LAJ45_11627 [Morchella importuna]|uniref:uncharacterized protein n=1 Tax=Morchella importuna TaxID=1174673 RepID=UPI001E8EDFC8|nr:uncharacterized protein LAJ45_11627 [Morchella importuna]KAH8144403.1 hypothetical protein LAJ45_11627 [Morchella importuna]
MPKRLAKAPATSKCISSTRLLSEKPPLVARLNIRHRSSRKRFNFPARGRASYIKTPSKACRILCSAMLRGSSAWDLQTFPIVRLFVKNDFCPAEDCNLNTDIAACSTIQCLVSVCVDNTEDEFIRKQAEFRATPLVIHFLESCARAITPWFDAPRVLVLFWKTFNAPMLILMNDASILRGRNECEMRVI